MTFTPGRLGGILHFTPKVYKDHRGYFFESYNRNTFNTGGIPCEFVQDNQSFSGKGTLRGLHYQKPYAQDKLIRVLQGRIFDVALDIRKESPTFGQWESRILSSDDQNQMFIPIGFAHGFQVLSETAEILYKCTDFYHPETDHGVLWSDPALNIPWPLPSPSLSEKDANLPLFSEIDSSDLFTMGTLK